jgi:hypothetical protein
MLFIAWLLSIMANELLLWEFRYLSIISPLLFITMGGMYLYQLQKIKNKIGVGVNVTRVNILNLKVVFLIAILTLLAISVNMKLMADVIRSVI